MSSLKLRSTPALQRPSTSRRLAVVTKANSLQDLASSFANGIVRIFSKPQSSVDSFAENNFSGKIAHHGARKPVADGFSAVAPAKLEPTAEACAVRPPQKADDYLMGAVGRVMSNQFKGDATEPETYGGNNFTGQIHRGRKDKQGFHVKK